MIILWLICFIPYYYFYISIVMEKHIQNRRKNKLSCYRFLFLLKIILLYQIFIERKQENNNLINIYTQIYRPKKNQKKMELWYNTSKEKTWCIGTLPLEQKYCRMIEKNRTEGRKIIPSKVLTLILGKKQPKKGNKNYPVKGLYRIYKKLLVLSRY